MYCSRCGTETDDRAKFCPSCGLDFSTVTGATQEDSGEMGELEAVRDALQEEWGIESELGRGGMAIVYRARDKHLQRDVAIKVLPFSLAFDKQFVERFQREARTAGQLEHPHIIPIYRVGKSGRVIYFVMKFLRGGSLSELLEKHGKLSVEDIRRMLAETAGALHYAHRHDIVHRDIKPDNIMFDEMGHAVLTDFGIAKAATGTRLTGTGMSIGTPHYMSPEQARAQQLDGRSDIYSLGVVAYQCLTGQVPFDGEDAFSIGYKHIMEEVPTPQLHTAQERELFAIIKRMMAKSPEERFQSADELANVLQGRATLGAPGIRASLAEAPTAVIRSSELGLKGVSGMVTPTTPTTPIPEAATLRTGKVKKRKRSGVLVGLFLMLFLGAGGAGGYWYFVLGAEWPLPFMRSAASADSVSGPETPTVDSLLLATADSLARDSTASADTTAAAPSDTAVAPTPPPPLPTTGVLVLRGVPSRSRVLVDARERQDTVLELPPRTYSIRVERTGYEPFETSQAVARGDTVEVPVRLQRRQPVEPVTPPPPASQCGDPKVDTYNRDGSCFDTPPKANGVPLIPLPEDLRGQARPAPATLYIKVLADGSVSGTDWGSDPTRFALFAQRWARERMTYTPATKNGRPVDAWVKVTFMARP